MEDTNRELYGKVFYLQRLLQRSRMQMREERGPMADTSRGQGRVLAMLQLRDGISTKDLSYMLDIRIASLNELLLKLEKAEYIVREPSEDDKRVMIIRLTEKGRAERREKSEKMPDLFTVLTAEEKEMFGVFLDKIIAELEEKLGELDEEAMMRMRDVREKMGEEVYNKLRMMKRGFKGFMREFGPFDDRFSGRGGFYGHEEYDGEHEHGGEHKHDGECGGRFGQGRGQHRRQGCGGGHGHGGSDHVHSEDCGRKTDSETSQESECAPKDDTAEE